MDLILYRSMIPVIEHSDRPVKSYCVDWKPNKHSTETISSAVIDRDIFTSLDPRWWRIRGFVQGRHLAGNYVLPGIRPQRRENRGRREASTDGIFRPHLWHQRQRPCTYTKWEWRVIPDRNCCQASPIDWLMRKFYFGIARGCALFNFTLLCAVCGTNAVSCPHLAVHGTVFCGTQIPIYRH